MIGLSARSVQAKAQIAVKSFLILLHALYFQGHFKRWFGAPVSRIMCFERTKMRLESFHRELSPGSMDRSVCRGTCYVRHLTTHTPPVWPCGFPDGNDQGQPRKRLIIQGFVEMMSV